MKAVGLASFLIAVFASSSLTYSTTLTELGGFRAPSAGNTGIDTNATFAIGMTTDNGLSSRSNALPPNPCALLVWCGRKRRRLDSKLISIWW